jgi:hypothetical protein
MLRATVPMLFTVGHVKESLITMDWRVYAICLEDVAPNVPLNMLSTLSRTADRSPCSILGIVWGANNVSP